jgi:hypothetical protein
MYQDLYKGLGYSHSFIFSFLSGPLYSPLYGSRSEFLTSLGEMWELADSLGTIPLATEVLVEYPPFLMFRDRLDTSSLA